MKNINKFFVFIKNLPFFHFFSFASSIYKLVIFWTWSSLFYLINYCIFDSYEFFSKRSRQKGKILPNLLFTISRQISKFVKILYIKIRFNVVGGHDIHKLRRQGRIEGDRMCSCLMYRTTNDANYTNDKDRMDKMNRMDRRVG